MATININNLNAIGSNLFVDTESYLQDLSELDLSAQVGGGFLTPLIDIFTSPVRTL